MWRIPITGQQKYVRDILAVSTNKKMPEIPLTIRPNNRIPTPPRQQKGANELQQTTAENSALTSRKPKVASPKEGNAAITSQKLSRQIGEKSSENNVEDENKIREKPVIDNNPEEIVGDIACNVPENIGIRRLKRIPNANRTEKYGPIM